MARRDDEVVCIELVEVNAQRADKLPFPIIPILSPKQSSPPNLLCFPRSYAGREPSELCSSKDLSTLSKQYRHEPELWHKRGVQRLRACG